MMSSLTAYRTALADFSQPGAKWDVKGRLVYYAKKSGLSVEDVIADVREVGVTNRDADIRRGWEQLDGADGETTHLYTPRLQPRRESTHPDFVRKMVTAGGGTATIADLTSISPRAIIPTPQLQTRDFFRTCYGRGDKIFIDDNSCHRQGIPDTNIRTVDEWVNWCCLAGDMGGDTLIPNPLSGEAKESSSHKSSYILAECITSWPYVLVEFDALPLAAQCAFWLGFIEGSVFGRKVAAITYSGSKSLHGLLRINAASVEEWRAATTGLRRLLCADDDRTYRCDHSSLINPRQATRLPGVYRRGAKEKGAGNLQELLYLNPDARKGDKSHV